MRGKRQEKGASPFASLRLRREQGGEKHQRSRPRPASLSRKRQADGALPPDGRGRLRPRRCRLYGLEDRPRGLSLYGPDGEVLQPGGHRHLEGGRIDHLRAVVFQEARHLRALSVCGRRPPVEERRLRRGHGGRLHDREQRGLGARACLPSSRGCGTTRKGLAAWVRRSGPSTSKTRKSR